MFKSRSRTVKGESGHRKGCIRLRETPDGDTSALALPVPRLVFTPATRLRMDDSSRQSEAKLQGGCVGDTAT
eukprot:577680-Prymnesium_polylepis.1